MSFTSQSPKLHAIVVTSVIVLLMIASAVKAEPGGLPVLTLRLQNNSAPAGSDSVPIGVYLANYQDTLSAFALRVLLEEPGFLEFRTDIQTMRIDTIYEYCDQWIGTTCVHWVTDVMIVDTVITSGAVDTAGTLISGWEYVTAKSLSENLYNVKVTAIADKFSGAFTPGIPPRGSEGLLFKLLVRTFGDLPSEGVLDSIINVQIVENLSETNFSDPNGQLIGAITNYSICDTSYGTCLNPPTCDSWKWVDTVVEFPDSVQIDTFWHPKICAAYDNSVCTLWTDTVCTDWDGENCLNWEPVTELNADSIFLDSLPWTVRDTSKVFYSNSTFQVLPGLPCECGDTNGDGGVNIVDASYLIFWIFFGGPDPANMACADASGEGLVNIVDASFLINFIFFSGPDPICNS